MLDFDELQVRGDGNCFYRATAILNGLEQENHEEIRLNTAEILEKTNIPIELMSDEPNLTKNEYMERVRSLGTYSNL